ncbi:unnamed protein product [Brassicogethes aeneus]|uniref:Protein takeout-like n=1 Tax=Brassicogethes aeneus TaxID=1431903 RepID=A0A9P0B6L2_BRAAE|nr:unnamed protein product [Brassicogethes aeneus]
MDRFVFSFLCMVSITFALHIPSYIKPCKKNDPNLNDCALKQTKLAFPFVSKGDKQFKARPLNPFFLPFLEVDAGANLELKLINLTVNGLDNIEFKTVNYDIENNKSRFIMSSTLNFVGKYEINGQILVLPIRGDGNCNITFSDGDFIYDTYWTFVEKNSQQFAKINNTKLDMKLKRAHFNFENLFNGDKLLGDNMNKVLNDNWEDVMKEIGPGITHTLDVVATSILKAYFENIPYEEMFV